MKNLFDMIIYLFLIAIPECTFITVMTLIFMKRYDFLDIKMWKSNIKWKIRQYLSPKLMFDSGFMDYCKQKEEQKGSELNYKDYELACLRYGMKSDFSTIARYKKKYENYKKALA